MAFTFSFFIYSHPRLLLLLRILQLCFSIIVGIALIVASVMGWDISDISIHLAGKVPWSTSIETSALILFLVASIIITLYIVSASFLLMAFPSLMTTLLFHYIHAVRPLVNSIRISLEVVQLTLWLLTFINFIKKTEQYDFVHTAPDAAPIGLWSIGLHTSIAQM